MRKSGKVVLNVWEDYEPAEVAYTEMRGSLSGPVSGVADQVAHSEWASSNDQYVAATL